MDERDESGHHLAPLSTFGASDHNLCPVDAAAPPPPAVESVKKIGQLIGKNDFEREETTQQYVWNGCIDVQGDRTACAKPPVDFKTKVPLQARLGQAKTELLF